MSREFEIIGAGAVGSLLRRKPRHAPAPGSLCLNCAAQLQGFFCHVCGQEAGDHHRSIWHVIWDGVEGLTHLDGRLGQTLPPLFFNPGLLARDHLEGRRQRHVPPFRLFLISLLIFMFVLEGLFHGAMSQSHREVNNHAVAARPAAGAKRAGAVLGTAKTGASRVVVFSHDDPDVTSPAGSMDINHRGAKDALGGWLTDHIKRAASNREYYSMVLFTWAHRLAILLLPILAALLSLIYVREREFFIYDHLVVAMQFLSFEFLIFALAWLIPDPARDWALWTATIWTPLNLYMILRGAYRSRAISAAIKTLALWVSTLLLFAVLITGLLALALAEM